MIPEQRSLRATPAPTYRKTPNEQFRAWLWDVAIVALIAAAVVAIFGLGIAAVLNFGTWPGLVAVFVLFVLGAGTGIWYCNGKQRL